MTALNYDADVIVVGSGVAGALVAWKLAKAGKKVIILEAGPRVPRWQTVERFRNQPDKYDNSQCYPPARWAPHPEYSPANNYLIQKGPDAYNSQYIRYVGGTTWHWAGSAWRFLPADFRLYSNYGVGRDWPISYDDLEKYYQEAEEAMGVWGDQDYHSPRSKSYPMKPLKLSYNEQTVMNRLNGVNPAWQVVIEPAARNSQPYDGRAVCDGNNSCMPVCPIGAMYSGIVHVGKAEQAGAKLIENAVVYKLLVNSKGNISSVVYKDSSGKSQELSAKSYVLAANGIETPKILLMSTSPAYPDGVANSSGMVGRNLMDHPGTSVTFYASEPLWPGRGPEEMTSVTGMRDGTFRRTEAGKKLHLSNMNRIEQETRKLLKQGILYRAQELNDKILDRAARYVRFDSFHELLPNPSNRIVPSSTQTDALGIPRPEISYTIDDYVRRSAAATRKTYSQFAAILGGSDISYGDTFQPNNHITGTTLMGDNPRDSVVDKDCRTHDHGNLFVAGSSTMPTVGTVNVTLTLAALALRLADKLVQEM